MKGKGPLRGAFPILGNRAVVVCVVECMPTFVSPTYEQAFLPEPGSTEMAGLMRHYDFPVGYSVLITGGTATPYPGRTVPTPEDMDAADPGSGENGKAVFLGGRRYTVTSGEGTILTTAGYTVT